MSTLVYLFAGAGFVSLVVLTAEVIYRRITRALADKDTMFLYVQFLLWKRKKTPMTPNEAFLASKLMEAEKLLKDGRNQIIWHMEWLEHRQPGHLFLTTGPEHAAAVDKYLAAMPKFDTRPLTKDDLK